jgi:hypothetical protein
MRLAQQKSPPIAVRFTEKLEEKKKAWWGQATSRSEERMWEEWIIEIDVVAGKKEVQH